MRASKSPFESYKPKQFIFRLFNLSLSFQTQSTPKRCQQFVMFNLSENSQNSFEVGFKEHGVIL